MRRSRRPLLGKQMRLEQLVACSRFTSWLPPGHRIGERQTRNSRLGRSSRGSTTQWSPTSESAPSSSYRVTTAVSRAGRSDYGADTALIVVMVYVIRVS